MQKEITKTMTERKKYGERYERMNSLRNGDKKLIAKTTRLSYITVIQQLHGDRKIRPDVKALADKLADANEKLLQQIENINL